MLILNGRVHLVGDPHLARKFEMGVPLHRRGDRERMQLEKFILELNTPDVDQVVIVGDVFDHPHVGYHAVLSTFEALRDTTNNVIVMTGNHDEPRNTGVVSAIDLLDELCQQLPHVTMVRKDPKQIGDLVLFPWDWATTAEDQVAAFEPWPPVEAAIGHWDLISFGGDESHMAPVRSLHTKFGQIPLYSGHYHIEGDFVVDGVTVHCTGSMEPYSHGEDPNGERYLTMTLAELEACSEDLTDKCVRILLAEGEELPTDLDCLALTAKRLRAEDVQLEEIDTSQFSWKEILEQSLEDVPQHVREFIDDKMKEYEE